MPSPRHLNSGDRENAHRKDGDGPFAVRVDRNEKLSASCLNADSFRIDSGQTQDEDAQVVGSSGFLEVIRHLPFIHERDHIFKRLQMIRYLRFHRARAAKRLMDAHEVVMHEAG